MPAAVYADRCGAMSKVAESGRAGDRSICLLVARKRSSHPPANGKSVIAGCVAVALSVTAPALTPTPSRLRYTAVFSLPVSHANLKNKTTILPALAVGRKE
eukprot:gene13321-19161_t